MVDTQVATTNAERALLLAYFQAFGHADLDTALDFLHPQVEFARGSWPPLRGRSAFATFYRDLWCRADERIRAIAVDRDRDGWHVHLLVDLTVRHSIPEFPDGPLPAGHTVSAAPNCLWYRFDDGLIREIIDCTDDADACPGWPSHEPTQ